MIAFMKCLGIGQFIVTESRLVVSRSWGKKERGVTAYWVSVWNGELVLNLAVIAAHIVNLLIGYH